MRRAPNVVYPQYVCSALSGRAARPDGAPISPARVWLGGQLQQGKEKQIKHSKRGEFGYYC